MSKIFVILRKSLLIPMTVLLSLVMAACSSDDDDDAAQLAEKTLFVYMPWSGNSNALTSYFYGNISDLKTAVVNRGGLGRERIVVLMSVSNSAAKMFEIVCRDGECSETLLKEYVEPPLTTSPWITSVLHDVKTFAPASSYAMVIGGHGYGWVTAEGYAGGKGARRVPYLHGLNPDDNPLTRFFDNSMTRFFGGTQTQYRTDIATLAKGISDAGVHMQYILFDVCYMSSIEAIYDLRSVADHVIACPTEIMNVGMPYDRLADMLLGSPDYAAVCDAFLAFYKSYSEPYATIAVTRCAELEGLAAIMREINGRFTLDEGKRAGIQRMDGNSPTLFYDLGDYVDKLCTDSVLLRRFRQQLDRAVPYKAHTAYYPYAYSGYVRTVKINAYSGITTSVPSTHSLAAGVEDTGWHTDTH